HSCYNNEKLPNAPASYDAEILTTEDRLMRIVEDIKSKTDHTGIVFVRKMDEKAKRPIQTELFPHSTEKSESGSKESITRLIPIPKNIHDAKIESSHSLALVFWALVNSRVSGAKSASGALLTRIINQCLLDDQHKVEPTNISRVL